MSWRFRRRGRSSPSAQRARDLGEVDRRNLRRDGGGFLPGGSDGDPTAARNHEDDDGTTPSTVSACELSLTYVSHSRGSLQEVTPRGIVLLSPYSAPVPLFGGPPIQAVPLFRRGLTEDSRTAGLARGSLQKAIGEGAKATLMALRVVLEKYCVV